MTLQDEIRIWIKWKLNEQGRGARKRFADFLNLTPNQVTRMLNTESGKESRIIRATELVKIKEFFEGNIPGEFNLVPPHFSGKQKLEKIFQEAPPELQFAILAFAETLIAQEKKK